jgi:hypothetical protein
MTKNSILNYVIIDIFPIGYSPKLKMVRKSHVTNAAAGMASHKATLKGYLCEGRRERWSFLSEAIDWFNKNNKFMDLDALKNRKSDGEYATFLQKFYSGDCTKLEYKIDDILALEKKDVVADLMMDSSIQTTQLEEPLTPTININTNYTNHTDNNVVSSSSLSGSSQEWNNLSQMSENFLDKLKKRRFDNDDEVKKLKITYENLAKKIKIKEDEQKGIDDEIVKCEKVIDFLAKLNDANTLANISF